jgi:hypothetical protein
MGLYETGEGLQRGGAARRLVSSDHTYCSLFSPRSHSRGSQTSSVRALTQAPTEPGRNDWLLASSHHVIGPDCFEAIA